MRRKLRMLFIFIILFIIASIISVYSYGTFAKKAKGEDSYALPVIENQTPIDFAVAKGLAEHPNESGLILVTDNLDAFAIRAITAREAGRSLDLQYYIWKDDLTGKLLDLELLKAADRGVKIRLLLDDMNAHGRNSILAALNVHPNIQIRMFNPTRARDNGLVRGVELILRALSVNRRMHNKAWIADGRIAIVGGRNVGDEYFAASKEKNFFDADLVMSGQIVAETSHIFDQFWNSDSAIPLEALIKTDFDALDNFRISIIDARNSKSAEPYIGQIEQTESMKAVLQGQGEMKLHWTKDAHVYSDPPEKVTDENKENWLIYKLLPAMVSADSTLKVISPYFVPRETGLEKFAELSEKGIHIDILTNSLAANDVLLVHGGYAPYRVPLLEHGINLYELKTFGKVDQSFFGSSGASLHTKAFLVDDRIGFVGSLNFDPRSVMLNTEMGVLFSEPTILTALAKEFEQRSSADYSYKLILEDGDLRWLDESDKQNPQIWDEEPQSSWWQRITAKIAGWLPIESQL